MPTGWGSRSSTQMPETVMAEVPDPGRGADGPINWLSIVLGALAAVAITFMAALVHLMF